jgi:hypothetical protein
LGVGGRAEMDAVVLCSGLEHDALWLDGGDGEGFAEVLEQSHYVVLVNAPCC